ncbi:outer membrane protein assembly factor BamE [Martelella endophytica]|uniref:outer membrane protein assembly factor BamE n=1 Tax=Martelella endophytica TaxID=1486262 RepID=UPI0005F12605
MKTRRNIFEIKPLRPAAAGALVAVALIGSGCSTSNVIGSPNVLYQGYVIDDQMMQLVKEGSSREQVLLSLGQPSATATFDNEVFYYISQQKQRRFTFQKPRLVSQDILAVYFNKDGRVERLGHYTLQDGKLVNMASDTTPTGGKDITFLQQILQGTGATDFKNALLSQQNAVP